jgi:antitoxin MazE
MEENLLVTIKKWGNSASLRIPSSIMKSLNLNVGDQIDIKEENGRIVIAPIKPDRFTLEDLLLDITPENLHTRIDLDIPRKGY